MSCTWIKPFSVWSFLLQEKGEFIPSPEPPNTPAQGAGKEQPKRAVSAPLGRGSRPLLAGTQRSEQPTWHSPTLTHTFLLFFSYGAALLQKHRGSPWGLQVVYAQQKRWVIVLGTKQLGNIENKQTELETAEIGQKYRLSCYLLNRFGITGSQTGGSGKGPLGIIQPNPC